MMKTKLRLICSILAVLTAGTTGSINAEEFTSTGDCLFDFGHINYAWGQQIWGFYIDKNGSVFTYEKGSSDSRWYPDKVEVGSFWSVTKANLESKYSNKTFLGKLDAELLDEKIALISPSSEGEILRRSTGADAGQTNGNALLYDIDAERYLVINLGTAIGSSNDVEEENTSEEAKSLLNWLNGLHKKFVQPKKQLQVGIGSVKLLGENLNENDQWWWSKGFDYFSTKSFPWIYHNQLGWMFWRGDPHHGVYLFDLEDGWHWTAPDVLPHLYSFVQEEWIRAFPE